MADEVPSLESSPKKFFLDPEEQITTASLNKIFSEFAKTDEEIAGKFKDAPGVWFCKWYDDGNIDGYSKGDFFWVNTEDAEKFIQDNHQKIQELANKNPFFTKKLPNWKNNDQEIFDLYYSAMQGYVDQNISKALPPIFHIGQLSNEFNIIVSQKDHNKDYPDQEETSSWKRFAVNTEEDAEKIKFTINNHILSAISDHNTEFHLGNTTPTQTQFQNLSNYANEDFSNVKFSYPENFLANNFSASGLDCVDVFVKKPYGTRKIGNSNVEQTWFRKWKSGFLEHGGIIDVRNYLNQDKTMVVVPFRWKFVDDGSKFYQSAVLGEDSDPITIANNDPDSSNGNLIKVLYELDSLIVGDSEFSPTYQINDYTISLVPIQQTTTNPDLGTVESYNGLGNSRAGVDNVLDTTIINCSLDHFSFGYDPATTPNYYSYYVRGFSK